MTSETGVPVVSPSNTPERIFTVSGSRRCVVKRDWPGLRRSSQCWRSAAVSATRGGTPSTTQPMADPWLSPQVVKRKVSPKLLPAIGRAPEREEVDLQGWDAKFFSSSARRSEERRVGKECVSTCRSLCAPFSQKKKYRQTN